MIDTIILKYLLSEYTDIKAYHKDYNAIKAKLLTYFDITHKRYCDNQNKEQISRKSWDMVLKSDKNSFTLTLSLWKFYKGNSVVPFEIHEIKPALLQLSAFFGVRIEKGLFQRVDLAQNFEMDKSADKYIREVERPRGMEYLYDYTGQSIGFRNRSRNQQIVLYDKIKQFKKAGIPISEYPKHLLRYEFRFKKQMRHSINRNKLKSKVKAVHLYTSSFIDVLLLRWFQSFCKLQMPYVPDIKKINNAWDYHDYLIAKGIVGNGGLEKCSREIEQIIGVNGKPMCAPSKSKLRQSLEELLVDANISIPSTLVRELRAKVGDRFKALKRQQNLMIFRG